MTIKSDDINGRTKTYAAIQNGRDIPEPGIPESFRVLKHELQALALDVKFLDQTETEVQMSLIDGIEPDVDTPSSDEDDGLAETVVVGYDEMEEL